MLDIVDRNSLRTPCRESVIRIVFPYDGMPMSYALDAWLEQFCFSVLGIHGVEFANSRAMRPAHGSRPGRRGKQRRTLAFLRRKGTMPSPQSFSFGMRGRNQDRKPPHVYLEEQRHLERLHGHGVWKLGRNSLVKFQSGRCVWVLGHDSRWRWGVRDITGHPTVDLLNRVRRSVEARKPIPQPRAKSRSGA